MTGLPGRVNDDVGAPVVQLRRWSQNVIARSRRSILRTSRRFYGVEKGAESGPFYRALVIELVESETEGTALSSPKLRR